MMTPASSTEAATGETDQTAVLSFLARPVQPNAPVKRVDTHCSIVFLEPSRVLKIKRAVKLPYLDFSTLEKRQRACDDEIAVNKRHAPAIYRRVVPITRGRDGLAVGGTGPVVEWAVEMARFDEKKTLDHLAERDAIRPELGERLATILLESHRTATGRGGSSWLASLPVIIDRNTEQFCTAPALSREEIDRLHELSHQALARNLELLRFRAAAGQVRHCHGDAHLGNIVLHDGEPILFDAIEFDPNIATTDVLYDLAFPLMDLLNFRRETVANRLFNSYMQTAWDTQSDALCLLPLFLSLRAAIRANVLFTKARQQQLDQAIGAQARRYFEFARRLIEPKPPRLIAVGGKSGTGKSVLARDMAHLIAPSPGALVLRSDVIRKQLYHVAEHATLPPETYTPEASDRVYQAMLDRGGHTLGQGVSVVLDAAFLKPVERGAAEAVARDAKVDFRGIFLTAGRATRLHRVASRQNDASDATSDVILTQDNIATGMIDWDVVDASGAPSTTLERSTSRLLTSPTERTSGTSPKGNS
ncbi:bifunctional aminoglycoside phosphotransferase/ATP-binding protein [Bradyrhizobium mercantei]|uniref:bifunctional aminoglycoside phosphotransferase/ATP-binding protein n=1 Tax=Bradyrhizobium mercantei TaxID=1904807 RepID=UPI000977230D|nr:bifunctional aminoglycoside phosphotransferase/ATP-binding protein [Bradyrhizobium mercantei]